jgi:hypothetical protein
MSFVLLLSAFLLPDLPQAPLQNTLAPVTEGGFEESIPQLPSRRWYGANSQKRAAAYRACRSDVEGVFPADSVEQAAATVWGLIYNARARCRRFRAKLISAVEADRRAWREGSYATVEGDAEWAVDAFDEHIDRYLFSNFSIGSSSEK